MVLFCLCIFSTDSLVKKTSISSNIDLTDYFNDLNTVKYDFVIIMIYITIILLITLKMIILTTMKLLKTTTTKKSIITNEEIQISFIYSKILEISPINLLLLNSKANIRYSKEELKLQSEKYIKGYSVFTYFGWYNITLQEKYDLDSSNAY
ncbi:hypothetical protein H8356DRAFT_1348349 [Neocallimastix lanati (nom. inval.)]|nr:hypothetical protein H8356DRAFT_1348349 [Neocallimastix sp. JGI-2020a]